MKRLQNASYQRLQGLVMNGVKEFLLHNNLGQDDLHYQYTNVSVVVRHLSRATLLTAN